METRKHQARVGRLLLLAALIGALVFLSGPGRAASETEPASPSSAEELVGTASGTPVSASVTIAPAGGFENTAEDPLPAVGVSTPFVCYDTGWNDLGTRWGTYPYQQWVYETRHWCGYLNANQTTRTSGVHGATTLCNWGAPRHVYKVAGGNGYFFTDVNSGVHFDCPTNFPFIVIHVDDWQVWRCNMAGYCSWRSAGRS
jgi:hypothetical protein